MLPSTPSCGGGSAQAHTWLPSAGDQIVAHGYVGVYPDRGAYQLYVNRVQPAGRGQLYAQFEALKLQLEAEGLFDAARKRPIVPQPRRIGVVTSPDAAALRDIVHVLSARWPLVDVLLFGTLVQGSEAPGQIVTALAAANQYSRTVEPLDTLILARGGGSIEDLWAFNDARVAYALAESPLPVVTGIGHETDFTIADFVADLRAPTPSAAAAATVPDRTEIQEQLTDIRRWIGHRAEERAARARLSLDRHAARLLRLHPKRRLDLRRQTLGDRGEHLRRLLRQRLALMAESRAAVRLRLDALSPHDVLRRGYSIVQNEAGSVVRGPQEAGVGEELRVRTARGDYPVVRCN